MGLVVQELVDRLFRHEEPETSRTQALLLALEGVLELGFSVETYYDWQLAANDLAVMALSVSPETPARLEALERGVRWLCTTRLPGRGSNWDVDYTWPALYGFVTCVHMADDPRFRAGELRALPARDPRVPVIANVDAAPRYDAETSIEKDRDVKELIIERNRLETLIRNARRAMNEVGKSFDLEEQQTINGVLNDAELQGAPLRRGLRQGIYLVARGKGVFFDGADRQQVKAGSFIFVAAGQSHRFEDFSTDFASWVFFYGPTGGEGAA